MCSVRIQYPVVFSVVISAISEEDPLQWQKAQRKCERLLSEMDGGAGSEPHR